MLALRTVNDVNLTAKSLHILAIKGGNKWIEDAVPCLDAAVPCLERMVCDLDETDPVESLEPRALSASTSSSETDSEEDKGVCLEAELKMLLKDDAQKHALKCIRKEKEREERASVATEGQDNDEPFIREDDKQTPLRSCRSAQSNPTAVSM